MFLHHHPGRGLPSPRLVVLLIRTRQPAGSIDSLIRVSRRAEGGPNATQAPQLLPSSHWPPAPAGGQAAARGPPSERVQPPWATARAPNREPRGSLARPETRPGVQPAQQPFSGCGGSVETPLLLLLCHHRHGPFLPCWATGCTRFFCRVCQHHHHDKPRAPPGRVPPRGRRDYDPPPRGRAQRPAAGWPEVAWDGEPFLAWGSDQPACAGGRGGGRPSLCQPVCPPRAGGPSCPPGKASGRAVPWSSPGLQEANHYFARRPGR